MPSAYKDFRNFVFDPNRVDAAGKDVGHKVYWKLYAIENLVRVIVHSVLSAQVGNNWWVNAVDPTIKDNVQRRKTDYAKQPWHSPPGMHDIYYAFLSDLSKIIATNSHLFIPVISDIDAWIARIEQVRLPRNIVGHMNWPNKVDRQRIDVVYADLHQLVQRLSGSGTNLIIP
jgi:hypothetical protein